MRYLKEFIVVLSFVFVASMATAQSNYKTSIGLRLGPSYGFTIKHFISDKIALEGLVTSRYYGLGAWGSNPGIMFTGLAAWHFPIGNIQGFNWFIGGGFHIGVLEGYNNHPFLRDNRPYILTGLDVVGGVEYTLPNAPFTFQADLKPSIHLIEYVGIWSDEVAVSVRYTF